MWGKGNKKKHKKKRERSKTDRQTDKQKTENSWIFKIHIESNVES